MSLVNQTVWVVGGVGVIGRSITKGLLKAGATVIVNSRNSDRLTRLEKDLQSDRLVTVQGSLLPGYAAETVSNTLGSSSLHHVVAHGAVRYWSDDGHSHNHNNASYDETHSIGTSRESLLTMSMEDFPLAASHLTSLHLSAAQELFPRIQFSNGLSSYTFVTGDGSGHPGGKRSPFQEINAHQVWGLAAALRQDMQQQALNSNCDIEKIVNCRELRINLAVNRSMEEREAHPREVPLSELIGRLCAGMVTNTKFGEKDVSEDIGELLEASDDESLEALLTKYGAGLGWAEEEVKSA